MRTGHLGWKGGSAILILTALPAQATTMEVMVEKLTFKPAEITVAVGDTIKWVNNDVMAHTATVNGGMDVTIPPHQSASIVVTMAGTTDYYCRFHPNMRGRIVVQER
jgi:plastocyanin